MAVLNSTKTLSGSFGKVYHEGEHLTNVFGLELNVDVDYAEVKRSGTRHVGYKPMSIKTTGTIKSYKLSTAFIDAISQIMDDKNGAFVTDLHAQLDDPENTEMNGMYRIKNVQFTKIPAINFEHGSLVEEELPFVCEGYERM